MLLELLSKRSLKHLWSQMSFNVPRFGLVSGSISTVFMLTMCIIRRYFRKRLSRKKAMFIAAFLSAIPCIVGTTARE